MTHEQLKLKRKELKLSQMEMATKLGITQTLYSTVETGKRPLKNYENRLKELGMWHDGIGFVAPRENVKPVIPGTQTQVIQPDEESISKNRKYKGYNIDKDFKSIYIGDKVRHMVKGTEGLVHGYEWSGLARFIINTGSVGWGVWAVDNTELICRSADLPKITL